MSVFAWVFDFRTDVFRPSLRQHHSTTSMWKRPAFVLGNIVGVEVLTLMCADRIFAIGKL